MKNQDQVLDFNVKLQDRVKDGLKIAKRAARLAEQFGRPTENGFEYSFHNSTNVLIYDPLSSNVIVDSGPKFLFKANLRAKIVTVFRGASWINTLNSDYKRKLPTKELEDEDFVNMNSNFVEELMGL